MTDVFVSDFTKKTLAQFGWTDGTGIPDELGEFLLKAKDRGRSSTRNDVLIDIDTMLPEDIAEVQKMLAAQRVKDKRAKERAEFDETTKNMKPEVAAAYGELLAIEEQQPEIIDDREAVADSDNPFDSAAFETTPVDDTETPPEPAQTPPPDPAPVVLPFCPRCGWDMRVKFDIEVSEEDKADFMATLLGNTRFRKTYELMGGHFNVTFRSLHADENLAIHRQLLEDEKAGTLVDQADWFSRLFEYRLACSLMRITDKKGKALQISDELSALTGDETGTPMIKLWRQLKEALKQEVTMRLVGNKCREFQRLFEALEAMTLEPSFWVGIG